MSVLDIELLDIERLHRLIGGYLTSTQDFIVCKNMEWNPRKIGAGPLRAEANGMTLCTRGQMKFTVDLNEFVMKRGGIMIYGPAHVIDLREVSDDFRLDIIVFTNNFSNPVFLDMNAVLPVYRYLNQNSYDMLQLGEKDTVLAEDYFSLIYKVAQKEITDVTYYMVSGFIRLMSEIYTKKKLNLNTKRNRQDKYFEDFLHLVDQHHKEERAITYYAEQMHITPKHLSAVVKEYSGKAATDWINDFVAQEAKILLRFTTKSIQEIAYELNFPSQSFFGRFFKRITGKTPSEYRIY